MPVCKICSKLIKPLGMPVCVVEQMEVFLTQIVKDVNYQMGGPLNSPRYPVPAVRYAVEYCKYLTNEKVAIVMWQAPCNLVKVWHSSEMHHG